MSHQNELLTTEQPTDSLDVCNLRRESKPPLDLLHRPPYATRRPVNDGASRPTGAALIIKVPPKRVCGQVRHPPGLRRRQPGTSVHHENVGACPDGYVAKRDLGRDLPEVRV